MTWYGWIHFLMLFAVLAMLLPTILSEKDEKVKVYASNLPYMLGLILCVLGFWYSGITSMLGYVFVAIALSTCAFEAYLLFDDIRDIVSSREEESLGEIEQPIEDEEDFEIENTEELREMGEAFATLITGKGDEEKLSKAFASAAKMSSETDEASDEDAYTFIGTLLLRGATVPAALMGGYRAISML